MSPALAQPPAEAPASSKAPLPAPTIACATGTPYGRAGRMLTLNAWAVDGAGLPVDLPAGTRWQPGLGTVTVPEPVLGAVQWQLPRSWGAARVRTQATLMDAAGRVLCSVELPLLPSGTRPVKPPAQDPLRGAVRAHRFLAPGEPEPHGHPALTWLLLPQPPADAERERHLAVMIVVLRQLPAWAELQALLPAEAIVPLLLPLRYQPQLPLEPARAGDAALRAAAQQLLDAYDHVRARALLQAMGVTPDGSGPLLVSRSLPPAGQSATLLQQDFSAVDERVADAWAQWALRLSTDPQAGQADRLVQLGLALRNIVAHAARAMPEIGQRAPHWVQVSQSPLR